MTYSLTNGTTSSKNVKEDIGERPMSQYRLVSSLLSHTGKEGKLVPDKDGYYTVTLGALNAFNGSGHRYTAERETIDLYERSSALQRRIKRGALYAEYMHPSMKPGMKPEDFYRRVFEIDGDRVCAHISEIWLDFDFGKNNPNIASPDTIAVRGKIKPWGPFGYIVKEALENSKGNFAFSVRGLTDDVMSPSGILMRALRFIVTYDFVLEPGIAYADRHTSPSLESHPGLEDLIDEIVDPSLLTSALNSSLDNIALESSVKEVYREVLEVIDNKKEKFEPYVPNIFNKWKQ